MAFILAPTASAGPVTPITWCGTDQVAVDRKPNSNALFVHVIYAFPADGQNNFAASADGIATDIAAINAWLLGQDPTRQIRFDLFPFPNCGSEFGQLDLSVVQLPNGTGHYQGEFEHLPRLSADLRSLGFNDPDQKYLVYYNGPVNGSSCGVSDNSKFLASATTYSSVFLGSCGAVLGVGGDTAATAAHEFLHALHALAVSDPKGVPPNTCDPSVPNSPGHPCDNPADLMAPQALPGAPPLSSYVLDTGRDDYYAHGGTWTDVQDSWFLAHLDKGDPNSPTGLNKVTPTSELSRVQGFKKPIFVSVLRWSKAKDPGGVTYRVYQDGEFVGITKKRKFEILTPAELSKTKKGKVVVLAVRAVDASGNLGPLRTMRFKVAFGIVNAKGKVTKDTVGPPPTKRIKFSQTATTVTLRWARARDTVSPIKGYLVKRNGKRVKFVKKPSITVPQSKAKGKWTVQARDKAGNLAVATNVLTVS